MKKVICISLVFLLMGSVGSLSASTEDIISPAVHRILQKAQTLIKEGNAQGAAKALEEFRQKASKGHYLLDFVQANAYLASSMPKAAIPLYEASLKKKPGFSRAFHNLGRCWFDLGETSKAGINFEKAYETSTEKDSKVLFYAASCHASSGDVTRALEVYDRLFSTHGDGAVVEWKEGQVRAMLSAGMASKALPLIEALAAQGTGDRRRKWQEVLLFHYVELKMPEKALDYARSLIQDSPSDPVWWKALSRLYLMQEDYEKALSALIAFGFSTPMTMRDKELAGDLYAAAGAPSQAAAYFVQVFEQSQ